MENRTTFLDFIGSVMKTFGICVCMLILLTVLANEGMFETSTLFTFGNEGISVIVLLQFLLAAFITRCLVVIFTSSYMIRILPLTARLILMPLSIILCLGIAIYFFDWFPSGNLLPWILFVVSFLICFGISVAVTLLRNKKENDKLKHALDQMK